MTPATLAPTTTDDEKDKTLVPDGGSTDHTGDDSPYSPPDPITNGLEEDLPAPPEPLKDGDPTPAAPAPDGWSKDTMGRWHRPNGTVASKAEVEARAAKIAADAPKAPVPATIPAASVAAEPAKPATPTNTPWTPNIYGKTAEVVRGALQSPDGHLFIPRDQVPNVTALIARGTKYGEVQHQRQEWAKEREGLVAPLKHENTTLHTILTNMADPAWLAKAAQNPDYARLEVANALAAIKIEQMEKFGPSAKPESPKGATEPAEALDQYEAETALREEMGPLLQHESFKGLWTDAEREALVPKLMQAYPFTTQEGAHVLDRLALAHLLNLYAEGPRAAQRVRAEFQTDKKVQDVTRRNTAAAPTPTASSVPSPAKSERPTKPEDDPHYADKPWENPALDSDTRRDLYYKHGLKIRRG